MRVKCAGHAAAHPAGASFVLEAERAEAEGTRGWGWDGLEAGAEETVAVLVALSAACGLTLLALRSMAYAFAHSVDARSSDHPLPRATYRAQTAVFTRREAALLLLDILLSVGVALATVGLAAMAAMPGRLTIGALLAQLAVLGALVAPPVVVELATFRIRPAAVALAVAQFASAVFFIRAIQSLL